MPKGNMSNVETKMIRVTNISSQTISLQVSSVGGDFFKDQHQIRLQIGQDVIIDEKYIVEGQVENLQKRSLLRVDTLDKK